MLLLKMYANRNNCFSARLFSEKGESWALWYHGDGQKFGARAKFKPQCNLRKGNKSPRLLVVIRISFSSAFIMTSKQSPSHSSVRYEGWLLIAKMRKHLFKPLSFRQYYCVLEGHELRYYENEVRYLPHEIHDNEENWFTNLNRIDRYRATGLIFGNTTTSLHHHHHIAILLFNPLRTKPSNDKNGNGHFVSWASTSMALSALPTLSKPWRNGSVASNRNWQGQSRRMTYWKSGSSALKLVNSETQALKLCRHRRLFQLLALFLLRPPPSIKLSSSSSCSRQINRSQPWLKPLPHAENHLLIPSALHRHPNPSSRLHLPSDRSLRPTNTVKSIPLNVSHGWSMRSFFRYPPLPPFT